MLSFSLCDQFGKEHLTVLQSSLFGYCYHWLIVIRFIWPKVITMSGAYYINKNIRTFINKKLLILSLRYWINVFFFLWAWIVLKNFHPSLLFSHLVFFSWVGGDLKNSWLVHKIFCFVPISNLVLWNLEIKVEPTFFTGNKDFKCERKNINSTFDLKKKMANLFVKVKHLMKCKYINVFWLYRKINEWTFNFGKKTFQCF